MTNFYKYDFIKFLFLLFFPYSICFSSNLFNLVHECHSGASVATNAIRKLYPYVEKPVIDLSEKLLQSFKEKSKNISSEDFEKISQDIFYIAVFYEKLFFIERASEIESDLQKGDEPSKSKVLEDLVGKLLDLHSKGELSTWLSKKIPISPDLINGNTISQTLNGTVRFDGKSIEDDSFSKKSSKKIQVSDSVLSKELDTRKVAHQKLLENDPDFMQKSDFIFRLQTDKESWHGFMRSLISQINREYILLTNGSGLPDLNNNNLQKLAFWRIAFERVLSLKAKSKGMKIVNLEQIRQRELDINFRNLQQRNRGREINEPKFYQAGRSTADLLREHLLRKNLIWWDPIINRPSHGVDIHVINVLYVQEKFDEKYGSGSFSKFYRKCGDDSGIKSKYAGVQVDHYYVYGWVRNFDFNPTVLQNISVDYFNLSRTEQVYQSITSLMGGIAH